MSLKLIIDQYAGYTRWANTRFVERLQRETAERLDQHTPSSFPSLRATVLHIRDAENAWLHRLQGLSPVPWPAEEDRSIQTLLPYTTGLHDLVLAADEGWLAATVAYHDLRGNRHDQPRWQMVLHAFNHGTQHRGQLITMMRALNMAEIPANDLIAYQRTLGQR